MLLAENRPFKANSQERRKTADIFRNLSVKPLDPVTSIHRRVLWFFCLASFGFGFWFLLGLIRR